MEIVWLLGYILLLCLSLVQWYILYQLIKQRGRLLMRLGDVEHRIHEIEQTASSKKENADYPLSYASEPPVGTVLNFKLPDLTGRPIGVEDFRGQRVLLVCWDPRAEACKKIAPEFVRLQGKLRELKANLILLSSQDREVNLRACQEYGLDCPILLMSPKCDLKAFHDVETPSACLLDEEGRTISPLAIGNYQVLRLAQEATSVRAEVKEDRWPSMKHSRIEREGLRAGTLAPAFNLPTIYGDTISLEAYRGRQVLLVFTSPHCTPCDYLAPHLVRLQQNLGSRLAVLMIGRGDPVENRQKAELFGFKFSVALQKHWEISRLYGIFSTPVAFLINESGVIEGSVAKGTDEILALAKEKLAAQQEVSRERVV